MNMVVSEKIIPAAMILFSGALVAVADGLIKRASVNKSSLLVVLRNPVMIMVGLIYLFAIIAFSIAFIKKWDLGIVGILQIIVYSVAVVLIGLLFFHERLSFTHTTGILLAVVAAILLNI